MFHDNPESEDVIFSGHLGYQQRCLKMFSRSSGAPVKIPWNVSWSYGESDELHMNVFRSFGSPAKMFGNIFISYELTSWDCKCLHVIQFASWKVIVSSEVTSGGANKYFRISGRQCGVNDRIFLSVDPRHKWFFSHPESIKVARKCFQVRLGVCEVVQKCFTIIRWVIGRDYKCFTVILVTLNIVIILILSSHILEFLNSTRVTLTSTPSTSTRRWVWGWIDVPHCLDYPLYYIIY